MRAPQRTLFGQLLGWSLAALALLWASFLAAGYLTGLHETEELVDGELASVAALLVRLDLGGTHLGNELGTDLRAAAGTRPPAANLPIQHAYQQAISLVVWDAQGRVLVQQGDAPLPPFGRAEGFATLQLGTPPQAWRSFARWTAAPPERRVMVLIDVDGRNELGWDIAGQVAAPGLWLLPALALGLGLALRRGLRPLRALSDDVRALQVPQDQGLHSPHPEAEFHGVVTAVNALVQRYHAALARERELASELAHELRTPLSALVLQARALRDAPGAATPVALAQLEHDALRAGLVLSELLALARASRAALADAAEPVDLAALARQVLADRAEAALAGGHDLALAGGHDLAPTGGHVLALADGHDAARTADGLPPFTVPGHAVLLGLALGNLVDNALVHSPGPTLVELRLHPAHRSLQVCNGPLPGADTAAAPAGSAASTSALGLGLGHRVVAKVAELHGAQFAAVPAPPGFSHCYELRFPPAAGAAPATPPAP